MLVRYTIYLAILATFVNCFSLKTIILRNSLTRRVKRSFVYKKIVQTPTRYYNNLHYKNPLCTPMKHYSGWRISNDSVRSVLTYDCILVVTEKHPKTDKLLNCEMLDVSGPDDSIKALGELKDIARPVAITFDEMVKLMDQCEQVEEQLRRRHSEVTKNDTRKDVESRGILNNSPFTLFSGIIPGTKWCGTGDIAKDYHDLGTEASVDKCCRLHDLCPVKVRAYSKRYNLTNQSLYTKSHCLCDDNLFDCLHNQESPTAHIMGNIYFNLVQVPCVESTKNGMKYRKAKNNF